MPRAKRGRRGRPSAISRLTVADLMQEIDRRRSMAGHLHARRADMERELEAISSEIAQLESIGGPHGQPASRGPGRPPATAKAVGGRAPTRRGRGGNELSLAARLHEMLRGRTMSVPEMADAVKKAGHKSKSKNFRTVVGLALLGHKKMFRRVSRGQYTAK